MKLPLNLLFACILVTGTEGCETKTSGVSGESEPGKTEEKDEINISPLNMRPLNEDAILEMNEPGEYQELNAGITSFNFEATNFRLGTSDTRAGQNDLATYASGRHITIVLNNELHITGSNTVFQYFLKPGRYTALAFLTSPDYISIKSPEAYVLRQFSVGNEKPGDLDLTGPNIFYSRPTGSLSGPETRRVLLDFYLVNCILSRKDFHVRVTIRDKIFMIYEWKPYVIRNLPFGENTVKLELLDKNGKPVNSPFPSATGKVLLYEREPV